jgi:phosphoglucomutase
MEVLTGFKYIGKKIKEFEEKNNHSFILGFEESYGYLTGTYARDKDAVVASLLICEAAAFYLTQGLTLFGAMQKLYEKYGYYRECIETIKLTGVEGLGKINEIMTALRETPPQSLAGRTVTEMRDYKTRKIKNISTGVITDSTLPVSNVLYFGTGDSWACIRPSGTEPIIKLYFGAKLPAGSSEDDITMRLGSMSADLKLIVNSVL